MADEPEIDNHEEHDENGAETPGQKEVDDEQCFPTELLREGAELERIQYFKDFGVAHPLYEAAREKIISLLTGPRVKPVIIVIGPAGVGKTFLKEKIEDELISIWAPQQGTDPGRIPVASVRVPAKDTSKPTWRSFYERLMITLEEPHVYKKTIYLGGTVVLDVAHSGGQRGVVVQGNPTIPHLRDALISCLRNRRPYGVLVDEGHHLARAVGQTTADSAANLKFITDDSRTSFVIFGTYKLMELLDMEGSEEEDDQLVRRTEVFHLRRYNESGPDRIKFVHTVNTFLAHMPFKQSPDMKLHMDFIYERTVGCVGVLRDWLARAYNKAVNEKAETLKLKHLKSTTPLNEVYSKAMFKKIKKFEHKIKEVIDREIDEEFEDEIEDGNKQLPTPRSAKTSSEAPKTNAKGATANKGKPKPKRFTKN